MRSLFLENELNIVSEMDLPKLSGGFNSLLPSPCHSVHSSINFPEDWNSESKMAKLDFPTHEQPKKSNVESQEGKKRKKPEHGKTETDKIAKREMKKALRAERNKRYAKESRDRKKQYIQYLEKQIIDLKNLIEYYRTKLGKYELIEKYTNFEYIKNLPVMKSLATTPIKKIIEGNSTSIDTNALELMKENQAIALRERQQAMDLLSQKLIEISIPIYARIGFWIKERNLELPDSSEIYPSIAPNFFSDKFDSFDMEVNEISLDSRSHELIENEIKASWDRIKLMIKRFVQCERKLQIEFRNNTAHFQRNILGKCEPKALEGLIKLIPSIISNPEISRFDMQMIEQMRLEAESSEECDLTEDYIVRQ